MASPEIKIIALSNVYTRSMHFKNKGDIERGHKHAYDHATLVSNGSVMVEMLDDNGNVEHSKIFEAPNLIFIDRNKNHRLTALVDNTVCACIHAIRTIDEDIVGPEFLIQPVFSNSSGKLPEIHDLVREKTNKEMKLFIGV